MVAPSLPIARNAIRPAETASVVLVDDSEFVLSLLRQFIARIEGLAVSASVKDVGEAIAYISVHPPQIILLDLDINGKSGLDVLKFAAQRFPHIKVFVVTSHAEDMYRRVCLDGGAYAFYEKGTQFAELIAALGECADRKQAGFCRGVS